MVKQIHDICRYVEEHPDEPLALNDLAKRAGMSRFHFAHRFKEVVGVTPGQYIEEARLRRFKSGLREEKSIGAALYDAGYGSPSRVYEKADARLGMTPAQYRRAGEGVSISYVAVKTPVGLMMIGATDRGLCFVQFGESEAELLGQLRREYRNAEVQPMTEPHDPQFDRWINALLRHLDGVQPDIDLPLDVAATAFQMRVWKYLRSIPYGDLQSYGEVAAGIGQPNAARAVAAACASNVAAIVIPCHRVIRGTGELGGYRWGVERKRALIDRERAALHSG